MPYSETIPNLRRHNMEKKSFGAYIRSKREQAGLTQRALAERLHVVESAVSKWERGLSYPDVTLVPDICRELSITEHEFFSACDDEKEAARDREATLKAALARTWKWFSTLSCLIALGVCFLCDLLLYHSLDWFWIVLTALGVFFSLTTLPLWLDHRRLFASMACATLSLLALLLACWHFAGGRWLLGSLAITAVSLALPWGLYLLWKNCPNLLPFRAAALFSLWLLLLLAVIQLFTGDGWLWRLGFPIAGICLAFFWAVLLILRLPIGGFLKAALLCLLSALAIPLGNALPLWTLSGQFDWPLFAAYFLPTLPFPMAQIGNRIAVWVLFAAALVLFFLGLARSDRKD